jgi:hypothetical protein
MAAATIDEIAELIGDRADEAFVDRIANLGPTTDEIAEALDDLEYSRRYGEQRVSGSARVEEVRAILEELPRADPLPELADVDGLEGEDEDINDGLSIVSGDELGREVR